jgi:flagellar biosynthesis/type III secretory pathway protein FliH
MVDWTNAAVRDALRKYHDSCGDMSLDDAMRAALDAAVKAQEMPVTIDYAIAYDQGSADGRAQGRAEAFEGAAKFLESIHHYATAALIRNLAKG